MLFCKKLNDRKGRELTTQGAWLTGKYPNLLARYGYAEQEIEKRVESTWQALIAGDDQTRIYYETEDGMAYVLDTGNLDVRTEGMSYGMMMAVQMDRQDIFNRLWLWAKTYMYLTEGVHAGYFAWSCNPDGTKRAWGPAPDGEEYFALALFFASHRWGDGTEAPFKYGQEARQLLSKCLHQGEDGRGYPMWNKENKLIKFVPEVEFTDPSYHLPHFYELFALWANEEDRPFWREAARASRRYLTLACHPETGLAPEYAFYDGSPNHERGYGHFYSDSYRVAANIGLDHVWFGRDERLVAIVNKLQAFFCRPGPGDGPEAPGTPEAGPVDDSGTPPAGSVSEGSEAEGHNQEGHHLLPEEQDKAADEAADQRQDGRSLEQLPETATPALPCC
ncbi:glycoside hydrolase family 8 [Caldalkalibacillus thermarum TA2.A1]|uniref:Glycoside hydrolase family 8 n=1 Tax=Caldalkalibacillus thermarum (strain TA2.A1) TaxID=986075 RepID=F5L479_CALTT|nr:glycosyl hydrolase family 8 [Caldalkalibacillus thermarum]EGL83844.1 glycoside hydrolase family 8 [Caldalkalibacillus thermarum TA2.A1]